MARPTQTTVEILKRTSARIELSNQYQWGHMGLCNCGFLAQEITHIRKEDIHSRAMERSGDWNEQLNDYCPTSGMLMDDIITQMLETGFGIDDLKHLENLSDPQILQHIPPNKRHLRRNEKGNVVHYLNAWRDLLEQELRDNINLTPISEIVTAEA